MNLVEQVKAKMTTETEKELFKAWNEVCDKLETHYKTMRPIHKVFEVHHMNEVARKAFLEGFVADKSYDEMKKIALNKVGLN